MCETFLAEAEDDLEQLNHQECQELKDLLESKTFRIFRRVLLRSRAEVLRKMEGVDSNNDLWRLQGRLRQLRDIDNLLPAVKAWIEKYEKEVEMEKFKNKMKRGA
jgi:hypothetical protein